MQLPIQVLTRTPLKIVAGLLLALRLSPANAALVVQQTNLISDGFVAAQQTDPNLIDPIGITTSATSPFWIAESGTGLASIDSLNGGKLTVNVIPSITIAPAPAAPTGVVFNSTGGGFNVNGAPAAFIFANLDGSISAWRGGVTTTVTVPSAGAVYRGLAIANSGGTALLYAANFRAGTVDVFNSSFQLIKTLSDPSIPAGFAPFNVTVIAGKLIVTYAQQDASKTNAVPGAGRGFVDQFNLDGSSLVRLVTAGVLDAPWGTVLAPTSFGQFAGDLLIGNFGDGAIDAFDPTTGTFLGALLGTDGNPLAIPDLWGLIDGNGGAGGDPNDIYFTEGLGGQHGLFGSLSPLAVPEPPTLLLFGAGLIGLGWVRLKTALR